LFFNIAVLAIIESVIRFVMWKKHGHPFMWVVCVIAIAACIAAIAAYVFAIPPEPYKFDVHQL
jgi:hypothetical protein